MRAKEYLQQAYKIESRINAHLEQIERLKDLATRATSTMSAERISGTPQHSKVEDCVCKMIDLENETNAAMDRLVDVKRDIQSTIAKVEDKNLNLLLTLRYLNFNTWEEIACKMGFTFQWVYVLHSRALQAVSTIMLGS